MIEKYLAQKKIIAEPLENFGMANPEVVAKMVDQDYRLLVLKQILKSRFLDTRIDIENTEKMKLLDEALRKRISAWLNPPSSKTPVSDAISNSTYLYLSLNQDLLLAVLNSLKPVEV